MKTCFISVLTLLVLSCNSEIKEDNPKQSPIKATETSGIPVLNFGTIHLSGSTDAYASITDVNNPQSKAAIKKIVDELVAFKPTIICVEIPPESTEFMNETYQNYKTDRTSRINYSEEVNVIAMEVARLSGTKTIYGIDNPIGFDYPSLIQIANQNAEDSLHVRQTMTYYEQLNEKPLLEQFEEINTKAAKMATFDFYNVLATMHTPGQFEGADVIAEFYKRNLRMYTNFSDIPVTKADRVLIVMGATHTAYFDVFIANSSKYTLENASNYTQYASEQ